MTSRVDLEPIYKALLDEDQWYVKDPTGESIRLDHKKLPGVFACIRFTEAGVTSDPSQMFQALVREVERKYSTGFVDQVADLLLALASTCVASWALKELNS